MKLLALHTSLPSILLYNAHLRSIEVINFVAFLQSVEKIISASKEDLVLCPGLGPQKVRKDTKSSHYDFMYQR